MGSSATIDITVTAGNADIYGFDIIFQYQNAALALDTASTISANSIIGSFAVADVSSTNAAMTIKRLSASGTQKLIDASGTLTFKLVFNGLAENTAGAAVTFNPNNALCTDTVNKTNSIKFYYDTAGSVDFVKISTVRTGRVPVVQPPKGALAFASAGTAGAKTVAPGEEFTVDATLTAPTDAAIYGLVATVNYAGAYLTLTKVTTTGEQVIPFLSNAPAGTAAATTTTTPTSRMIVLSPNVANRVVAGGTLPLKLHFTAKLLNKVSTSMINFDQTRTVLFTDAAYVHSLTEASPAADFTAIILAAKGRSVPQIMLADTQYVAIVGSAPGGAPLMGSGSGDVPLGYFKLTNASDILWFAAQVSLASTVASSNNPFYADGWVLSGPGMKAYLMADIDLSAATFAGIGSVANPFTGELRGQNLGAGVYPKITLRKISTSPPNAVDAFITLGTGGFSNNYTVFYSDAQFTFDVIIAPGIANGTVTADKAVADIGDTVTVTVSPSSGWQLKAGSLKVNGAVIDNAVFIMPSQNATITAEFELMPSIAGNGTAAQPYQLSTADDLFWFAARVNNSMTTDNDNKLCAVLLNNIDISSVNFGGIGATSNSDISRFYQGVFDGAGYTITVKRENAYTSGGLFNIVSDGAVIKNLTVAGSVSGSYVGGLAYSIRGASIINCENKATVTAQSQDGGGIANEIIDSIITNSRNSGQVTALQGSAGGLAAESRGATTYTNCQNTSSVTALYSAGGISAIVGGIGRGIAGADMTSAINCVNSGAITSLGTNIYSIIYNQHSAGGIFGFSETSSFRISGSSNSGAISGSMYAGGILGRAINGASASSTITNCTNSGNIQVTYTGDNSSIINGLLSNGSYTGGMAAGGIAGGLSSSNNVNVSGNSNSGYVNGGQGKSSSIVGDIGRNSGTVDVLDNRTTVENGNDRNHSGTKIVSNLAEPVNPDGTTPGTSDITGGVEGSVGVSNAGNTGQIVNADIAAGDKNSQTDKTPVNEDKAPATFFEIVSQAVAENPVLAGIIAFAVVGFVAGGGAWRILRNRKDL